MDAVEHSNTIGPGPNIFPWPDLHIPQLCSSNGLIIKTIMITVN